MSWHRKDYLRLTLLLSLLVGIMSLYVYLDTQGLLGRHLPGAIRQVVLQAGWWGPFVILSIFALQTVVPIPNILLAATTGAIYGPWIGSLLVIVGWLISATVSFYAGRYFGRHFLESHGSSWLKTQADLLQERGFMAVIFMRMIQVPAEAIGILCGMTRLLYKEYILASFFGILPSAITFTVLGRAWTSPRAWILFGGIFFASIGLAVLVRKRHALKPRLCMFTLSASSSSSSARRGVLETPHGVLQTPFFMPIATKGAVKTLSSFDIERLGSPILLSNTYHLWLRPGVNILHEYGGLHGFMDWPGAILTDSGGFQVFSLSGLRKLTQEGVTFQSHIDGAKMVLTPELCMEIQRTIGSDICMVLDVCTELPAKQADLERALELTTAWAKRSKTAFESLRDQSFNPGAKLFGIVQGGTDTELRKQSANALTEIGFDGYAVGGLSVGEPFTEACDVLDATTDLLPTNRPRYFMGGAQPHEIVGYVQRGIDMFDCVLPTRNARHGSVYRFVHDDLTRPDFYEVIHITNEKWKGSQERLASTTGDATLTMPIDQELSRYTMGYLRHLFTVDEMLGLRLATMLNVRFYLTLMQRIRAAIEQGKL